MKPSVLAPRCGSLVTFIAIMTSLYDVIAAKCPWAETGLSLWSDPATWGDGQVPGLLAEVKVTKRVLLDIQPPDLQTITVEAGGALVWGNVQDITLNVTYILVNGEFHVGSEDCRFRKRATINLYGLTNSTHEVSGFGRKFIGVANGGQLEFHGLDKMSWTKLAHTIPAAKDVSCSLLYDHATTLLGQETRSGLHVMVWNGDGSVHDFNVFTASTYDTLAQFLQDLPAGSVVGAAVKKTLGTPTEDLYTVLESLGATSIRSVLVNQNYAFIARIGQKSSAREEALSEDCASILDSARDLSFRVTSSAANSAGSVYFQVMDGEAANPKITVQHDVSSWSVGDEILVTSTDFDWRQAEVKKMVACADCLPNQIKLDSPFKYLHYGEVTLNVDERAEVALLTRDVKVQGQLEDECYHNNANEQWLCEKFQRDMFGGHIKAVHGSAIHVEGVELFQMGQQQFTASYPLHFHMMNDASGMWFRNNSIHHSLSRCVTVHGSHNSEVSDNVCYLHPGHGYFLEDSVEQNTTMDRNLGVGTTHGGLLLSDRHADWCDLELRSYCDEIATFWLTHPNNVITNNVAAGSDGSGFFYVFADAPVGVSKNAPFITDVVANNSLQYFPLTSFSGNVAHSCGKSGLFFDSKISTGEMDKGVFVPENGVIPTSPVYDPRDPPNENGVPVWTTMDRNTFYKNRVQNVWLKAGNVRVQQSSLADSQKGFFGGTIGFNSAAMVKDSVFVATTDNKGLPFEFVDKDVIGSPTKQFDHSIGKTPYDTIAGVGMYQGRMFVENCHFSRYKHAWWADEWEAVYGFRPVSPGAAISFQRSNLYPTKPWGHVKGIKFDSCDNVDDVHWVFKGNISTSSWDDKDGNKAHTFKDLDGSVTGQANTQVVIDRPFYTGTECVSRDSWHMTVCPYKYVQVEIQGSNGVLSKTKKDKSPLIFRRDDVPHDPIQLDGTQRNTYLLRTNRSYTVNFNPTLGDVPTSFDVRAANIEKGDLIRLALCLPKDTTQFQVRSDYPSIKASNPHTMASSLQELDDDLSGRKFFWDASVGLLYLKLISNETRQNLTEECAKGLCARYRITRLDGGPGPTDCSGYNNPPIAGNLPTPTPPQPKTCTGPDSAEGLGAVPTDVLVASPFAVDTCPATDPVTGRSPVQFRGCFKDKSVANDLPFFKMELMKAMTPQWCQNRYVVVAVHDGVRCFYRGFHYSAVTRGKRCWCGDMFGLHGVLDTASCSKPCTGDPDQTCGASSKNEVYTTGLALKPVPSRCGPNNLGEMFDGKCLYVQQKLLSVGEAQRLCARLGGNLVAIDSQEKQTAVEFYLRDKVIEEKVWTGLNHVRDATLWEQRDGKALGAFTFWKGTAGSDPEKHFVYISGTVGYMWLQTKDTTTAVPLCDLPVLQQSLVRKKRATGKKNSSEKDKNVKKQKYVATYVDGYVVMKLATNPTADSTDADATTASPYVPSQAEASTTITSSAPEQPAYDSLVSDVETTSTLSEASAPSITQADASSEIAYALYAYPVQSVASSEGWISPSDIEPCGENGAGRRVGSQGTCYLVLHELTSQEAANYACRIAKGTLADYTNRASEEQLANVLYRMGVDQDYWTAKNNKEWCPFRKYTKYDDKTCTYGILMKWANSMYVSTKVLKSDVAGAVCVLETLDSTKTCPTGWVAQGESCYLNMGTVVKSYLAGATLCERDDGSSYLVRVDSEAENEFLASFVASGSTVTSHVLLGLHYSPRHDDFIWGNGELPSYRAWTAPAVENLSGGSCTVLDPDASGSWSNAHCDSMLANLVCEMPAFV